MSFRGLVLLLALALVTPAVAQPTPDFSDVDDVLGGLRYVLRVDDLVIRSTLNPTLNPATQETQTLLMPTQNGTIGTTRLAEFFDVERIPYLRAGATWTARVGYRPKTCGRKLLRAELRGSSQSAAPAVPVRVKCARGVGRAVS